MDSRAPAPSEPRPRFVVDGMLGNVARDLRLLGFDTTFPRGAEDARLLRLAQGEARVLVTRDRGLARRAGPLPHVLVESPVPDEQTEEVLRAAARGAPLLPFSRCLACNGPLRAASPGAVRPRLPDHVAHTAGPFLVCTECHRAYWEGTHAPRLRARVRRLAGPLHPNGGPV